MPLYVQTFLSHCYPTLEVKLVKVYTAEGDNNVVVMFCKSFFAGAANWFWSPESTGFGHWKMFGS